jgi:hypothetical protein
MFDRILRLMRDKIRKREYIMSIHAEEEMDNDELSIYDVECVILNGKILERQKDKNTAEWKYKIYGPTISNNEAEVIVKLSPTEKLVVITVYKP